ncbi:zinc finger protein 567-like [Ambystoma mexicanum]|uniref:zinc finger protein 567-like n=1 Tax=Ambystoma mexicanum TaxID=8296 RepID=UPI0037E82813
MKKAFNDLDFSPCDQDDFVKGEENLCSHAPSELGEICTYKVTLDDIIVCFSEEQWNNLELEQKEVYKDTLKETYALLASLGCPIVKPEVLLMLERGEEPYMESDFNSKEQIGSKDHWTADQYVNYLNEQLNKTREEPWEMINASRDDDLQTLYLGELRNLDLEVTSPEIKANGEYYVDQRKKILNTSTAENLHSNLMSSGRCRGNITPDVYAEGISRRPWQSNRVVVNCVMEESGGLFNHVPARDDLYVDPRMVILHREGFEKLHPFTSTLQEYQENIPLVDCAGVVGREDWKPNPFPMNYVMLANGGPTVNDTGPCGYSSVHVWEAADTLILQTNGPPGNFNQNQLFYAKMNYATRMQAAQRKESKKSRDSPTMNAKLTPKVLYTCTECGKSFSRMRSLTTHQKTHLESESGPAIIGSSAHPDLSTCTELPQWS